MSRRKAGKRPAEWAKKSESAEMGVAVQTLSPETPEMPRIASFDGKGANKKSIRYGAILSVRVCLVDGLGGSGGPHAVAAMIVGKEVRYGGGVALG